MREQRRELQDLKGAQGKVPAAWEVGNKHFKIGDATPTPAEGMALAVVEGKGLTAMESTRTSRSSGRRATRGWIATSPA